MTAASTALSLLRSRGLPATAVLLLLLGVWLRCLGYFGDELQLSMDEAWWAQMVVDDEGSWIRPAGYVWLSKQLLSLINNEQVLRSLSLGAGIAQLPLFLLALRRSLSARWLPLLGLFLLAIQPYSVAMSKEFKPYALEACLHAALILAALTYLDQPRLRSLLALVVTSTLAPLFAWSVVFAYPGTYGVVGGKGLRERRWRDTGIAAAGVVTTLGVLGVIFAMRLASRRVRSEFWGNKYGVFFMGEDLGEGLRWYFDKTFDLAALPATLEIAWWPPALADALRVVTVVLVFGGVAALFARRRWTQLALWGLPWALFFLFNLAGKWPYGAFRTNVFMVAYTIALACHGLDGLLLVAARWRAWAPRALAVAVTLLAIAVAPWDPAPLRWKSSNPMVGGTRVRTAMERIIEIETAEKLDAPGGPKRTLLLDGHACKVFRYYADYHVDTKDRLGPYFASHFNVRCSGVKPASFRHLIKKHRASMDWLISARVGMGAVTSAEASARCARAVEYPHPDMTFLARCLRE